MIPTAPSYDPDIQWTRRLSTAAGEPMAFAREFKLFVADDIFSDLVLDVLAKLENDVLHVFSPDDESAFVQGAEVPQGTSREAGSPPSASATENRQVQALNVSERARLPVSIREWLPVGCQWIGYWPTDVENVRTNAVFKSNADQVVFPFNSPHRPVGPVALQSQILLQPPCREVLTERGDDAVRWIIAHELIHAFDLMRVVVPAVMDWNLFWNKALRQGDACLDARDLYDHQSLCLDVYGEAGEFLGVAEHWASHAEKWFVACHGKAPPKL